MHHSTESVNENFDFYGLEDSAPATWNDWFNGAAESPDGRAVLKVAAVGLIAAGVVLLMASRKAETAEMPA